MIFFRMSLPPELWMMITQFFNVWKASEWRDILNLSESCKDALDGVRSLHIPGVKFYSYMSKSSIRTKLMVELHAKYPRPHISISMSLFNRQTKKRIEKEYKIQMMPSVSPSLSTTHAFEPKTKYYVLSKTSNEILYHYESHNGKYLCFEERNKVFKYEFSEHKARKIFEFLGVKGQTVG